MKVSKKKIAMHWAFFTLGFVIHEYVGWKDVGMFIIIISVSNLSEIDGFRRGYLAAFSGDKE
jgi:uncharacterized membrane protein